MLSNSFKYKSWAVIFSCFVIDILKIVKQYKAENIINETFIPKTTAS